MNPMKSPVALVVLLAQGVLVAAAQASYSDLRRELDAYEPPALYQRHATAPDSASGAQAGPSDRDFETQRAKLEELKDRWQKALEERSPEEPAFFAPDAARLEKLRVAAQSDEETAKTLGAGFTLEDLEALALLRSRAVQAKEREFRATLEAYSQVENLDTILRRYSTFTMAQMSPVGGRENPDAIAARFPFPGVLALKGEVANQEVKAVWEELQIARRDAVTAARKAYWELLYTHDARETMARMLDLMGNLRSASSSRYEAGMTNYQDVIKVGIEQEKTREGLLTMRQMQVNMEAEIRELVALPPAFALGAPARRDAVKSVPALEELYPLARERRQELRRMRAMVGKMERMIEMQETMIFPGYSLNLSLRDKDEISRIGAAGGGGMAGGGAAQAGSFPESTTASMGEGLPKMPWFGVDDAYLRETRQKLAAQKKELEMEELAAVFGVREAWFKLDKAAREQALYGERVNVLTESALEASNRGYAAGKVMFSDVIESYTGWLEVGLSTARSRSDLGIARAELEQALGAPIRTP
ncbi:MAG: TolC family protein [Deltaproteobacteria bacterium]|nr:TolC family protein [Deltaproteobacteria bacterium]